MHDTAKDHHELIEHLEKALALCGPGLPMVSYFIELALTEAKAAQDGTMPR